MKRILIAGTGSGCGKTTVTLALLAALKTQGRCVAACKCGPDYIDPMFHRAVLGIPGRNLDPFFSTGEQLREQLRGVCADVALLEGVMGYYDGLGGSTSCSSYTVAAATETPVVLVVNARGMSASVGALLRGFRAYRESSGIVGVIFNRVSRAMCPTLTALAREEGLACIGCLPDTPQIAVESRHLGLVTAQELPELRAKIDALGAMAHEFLDCELLLSLAADAPSEPSPPPPAPRVKIAVAQDAAFCFTYAENLALLSSLGCEIVPFSPIADASLPAGISGLYLPGGYPELHAQALSRNEAMREDIRRSIARSLPTIAECGGFLYLHERLDGVPMAGVLPGSAYRTPKLQRFGYVTLTAKRDNLLCRAGQSIRAHEFHYWDSDSCGEDFTACKASNAKSYDCIHASSSLWAGFPHLYFPANPGFAASFVKKAEAFSCHTGS